MENRTFIWGIICLGIGILAAINDIYFWAIVVAMYAFERIHTVTAPENYTTLKAFLNLVLAVLKVVYFFIKEKIFRIKPKKN